MRLPLSDRAGEALAVGRIAVGAATWFLPQLSARVMGLPPGPATTLGLRLFGSRDLAVGIGYLQSGTAERDRWLLLGMGMDGADAMASMAAGKRGGIPWRNALLIAVAAAAAVATGAQARNT